MAELSDVVKQLKSSEGKLTSVDQKLDKLSGSNEKVAAAVKEQTAETKKQTNQQEKNGKSLTKGVGDVLKKDLKGGFDKVSSQITGPMSAFATAIPGVSTMGKMLGVIKDNAIENRKSGAADVEDKREAARGQRKNTTLLGAMVRGIADLKDSFIKGLDKLKQGGAMGLGILAGLVLAPIVALGAFFSQLAKEVKVLNLLTGGRLAKIFAPITKFFMGIKNAFKGAGFLGKIGKTITSVINFVKNIFAPLVRVAKGSAAFMAGLGPVLKFAATIGRTLGKLFLPITLIMSAIDFVSGFMRGYEEGGILGGIQEGIIGVVDGLVGGLIRMVTGAVAWILEAIGLDNFAASITQNVSEAIEGVYEAFRGIFDIIKGIFTLDFALVGSGIASIFDGVIEVITAPFDMIYGLIKDIFGFFGFELPDFDLAEFIKGTINSVVGWFTTLFSDPLLALQNLWYSLVGDGGLVDILFKPIDAAINWVLGIFGWSSEGNEFSLTQIVKDTISAVFMWIGDLFTNPVEALTSLWSTLLGGFDSLMGLLFYPIDATINWVRGLFGWSDPEGEEFSLWGLIKSSLNSVWEWLAGLFSFDLGNAIEGLLPSWTPGWVRRALGLGGGEDEEDMTEPPPPMSDEQIQAYRDALAAAQDRVARAEAGENVYTGPDFIGKSVDEEAIAQIEAILSAQARAMGGPIRKNRPYIVGERGPELIVPDGAGQVLTANKTSSLISAASENAELNRGGANNVVINNAPQTNVSGGSRTSTYIPVPISDQTTLAWNGSTF